MTNTSANTLATLWREAALHGYARPDGRMGIRNYVMAMAAADNVNPILQHLTAEIPGLTAIPADYGRGQLGDDLELTLRCQANLAAHPNVAASLIISFEPASSLRIVERVNAAGREVAWFSLLQEGGLTRTLDKAIPLLRESMDKVARLTRTPIRAKDLLLGLECGGSDTSSGLAANPCLGRVSDGLIAAGGSAVFSEPVECLGCESFLEGRARTSAVAAAMRKSIAAYDLIARSQGVDLNGINPTADNIQGGLSTIEEKALGAIAKSGSAPIEGVLQYGERPSDRGLWFMDAPAAAVENLTALAAGGCQLTVFTTGTCNPMGHSLSPTLKACANPETVPRMAEHLDQDLSAFFTRHASLAELAEQMTLGLIHVVNGESVAAERLGFMGNTISRIGRSV